MSMFKRVTGGGYNRSTLATHKFLSSGTMFAVFLCLGILTLNLVLPSIISAPSASAEGSVGSSTLSVNVKEVISIRVLDSTASSAISSLDFNVAPTPNGSTYTNSAVVDVATSNETGYTLYMSSDYQDSSNNNYTTNLTPADDAITTSIPTSTTASSNFWNYELISGSSNVIPEHTKWDTLRSDVTTSTESSQTPVAINVNVDNSIPSGTYRNRLVFTAVANYVPQYTYMQDFTTEDCFHMAVGSTTTLADNRDGNTYGVVRMSDGTCWMNQNLRTIFKDVDQDGVIGIARTDGWKETQITEQNTNIGVNSNTGSGNSTWIPANETASSTNNTWIATDSANSTNTVNSYDSGNESYGTYYNWYTATAGTGLGTMQSASATNLTNASASICPKGWQLPYGGSNTAAGAKSWASFDVMLGGTGGRQDNATHRDEYLEPPYNFLYSGHYYQTAVTDYDHGDWLSATAATSAGKAYDLYIRSDGVVNPLSFPGLGSGFSIRCVQSGTPISNTMQAFTQKDCNSIAVGTNKLYYDNRDGNTYTVTRTSNNVCWMTQNLNIAGGTTLTPNDSHVSSNYTLPESSDTGFNNYTVPNVYNVDGYGGLYNFAAATAGTNPYSGVASSDICPKSWKLPTKAQWDSLISSYNTVAKIMAEPISVKTGGFISGSSFAQQGNRTLFWTSTVQTTGRAYLSYVYKDTNTLGTNNNESSVGISVRCVFGS